jgi:hypothetical protein
MSALPRTIIVGDTRCQLLPRDRAWMRMRRPAQARSSAEAICSAGACAARVSTAAPRRVRDGGAQLIPRPVARRGRQVSSMRWPLCLMKSSFTVGAVPASSTSRICGSVHWMTEVTGLAPSPATSRAAGMDPAACAAMAASDMGVNPFDFASSTDMGGSPMGFLRKASSLRTAGRPDNNSTAAYQGPW